MGNAFALRMCDGKNITLLYEIQELNRIVENS